MAWDELKAITDGMMAPWAMAGYFNFVLFNQSSTGLFVDCTNYCSLLVMGFCGHSFSWNRGNTHESFGQC